MCDRYKEGEKIKSKPALDLPYFFFKICSTKKGKKEKKRKQNIMKGKEINA